MEIETEVPEPKEELTILEQQDQLKEYDHVEAHEKGEEPTNRKAKYISDISILNAKSKFYEMNLIGIAAQLNILKKYKLKLEKRKENQKIMALNFQHLTRGGVTVNTPELRHINLLTENKKYKLYLSNDITREDVKKWDRGQINNIQGQKLMQMKKQKCVN